MNIALLFARLLLAGVFVVAGIAKFTDRVGSRRAVIDFGVPTALATPLAVLLPLAELAVAAALITTTTAWWGALGALALLGLFVLAISISLARGRKPDCHCFGQLHSAPAGWKTLGRNGVLAAVAGFVIWQGYDDAGPSGVGWIGSLSSVQVAILVGGLVALGLLAGQWWFLVHLLGQNGRLLVRLEALEARLSMGEGDAPPSSNGVHSQAPAGLPVGTQAPTFNLSGLYGETLTLDALLAPGKPVMLLFTDPDCGPCTILLPEIGRWQEEHGEKLTIALISRGTVDENRAKSSEHGLTSVLLQEDWEVSEAYQVRGTPSAVLIQSDGTIASPVAGGAESIKGLVAHAAGERAQLPMQRQAAQGVPCPNCGKVHAAAPAVPAASKVGEPALEVKLPDLHGNTVELKEFMGEETLVLFWNPGCGFCQQMLPDLREWEANPGEDMPNLLVVSTGPEEANREMGFSSPVVLDDDFSTGRSFGASGTPSAVLVDAEGRIASEVAVGAPAVLELAGTGRTRA
jgi:methylamine dehydrogenase accessory protein MauD